MRKFKVQSLRGLFLILFTLFGDSLSLEEFKTGVVTTYRFACGSDRCDGGLQFCDVTGTYPKCSTCSSIRDHCFKKDHHHNCTQYCLDQYKQRVIEDQVKWRQRGVNSGTCVTTEMICLVVITVVGVGIVQGVALAWYFSRRTSKLTDEIRRPKGVKPENGHQNRPEEHGGLRPEEGLLGNDAQNHPDERGVRPEEMPLQDVHEN